MFVGTYKYLYIGMLTINLLLTMIGVGDRMVNLAETDRHNIYVINVVTLGLNIISRYGYVCRFRWGLISERALSLGRMLVTSLVGPLLLIDVVFYSPVFLLVWKPLLTLTAEVARRSPEWGFMPVWWLVTAVLLAAEGLYRWAIGASEGG